jgi:hypothetical protein
MTIQQPSSEAARRGPTSGVHRAIMTPKPLLASEVLREELAPFQPAHRAGRVWLTGVCVSLVLLGIALRLGLGIPAARNEGATIAFSVAGAAAAVALLPFPYALRAGVAWMLAAALVLLGLSAAGPLAGLATAKTRLEDLARLLVFATLPAALLFRARYRAYRPARWVLAATLGLSLPFLALELRIALDSEASAVTRLVSGLSIAAVLSGLFGFMGAGTTGGGSVWAAVALAVLALEVAARDLTTPLAGAPLAHTVTAIGLCCAAILATLGGFQLLAAGLARDARRLSSTREPVLPALEEESKER